MIFLKKMRGFIWFVKCVFHERRKVRRWHRKTEARSNNKENGRGSNSINNIHLVSNNWSYFKQLISFKTIDLVFNRRQFSTIDLFTAIQSVSYTSCQRFFQWIFTPTSFVFTPYSQTFELRNNKLGSNISVGSVQTVKSRNKTVSIVTRTLYLRAIHLFVSRPFHQFEYFNRFFWCQIFWFSQKNWSVLE